MRLVLADDHKIIRDGLRAILERHPGISVTGEAGDGHGAVAAVAELAPDMVVMDMSMPGLNGLEATKRISTEHPHVKTIALSMHSDRRNVMAMLSAGASAYLLKSATADELLVAIEAVAAGRTYLSPQVSDVVVGALRGHGASPPADAAAELSSREREVLQLLAEGLTSKEIASRLDIAVTTVETHRRQIMTKLDLHSIAALTKYAVRAGLTSLDH